MKRKIRDLTDRVGGRGKLFGMIARGELPVEGEIDDDTLDGILVKLKGLAELVQQNRPKDQIRKFTTGEIYTVRIRTSAHDEEGNTELVSAYVLSEDTDTSQIEDREWVYLEELATSLCVDGSIPQRRKIKRAKSQEGKGGRERGKGTKEHVVVDPVLAEHILKHRQYFVSLISAHQRQEKPQLIEDLADMREFVGNEMLERLAQGNYALAVLKIEDFMKSIRRAVERKNEERAKVLLDRPEVNKGIRAYIGYIKTTRGRSLEGTLSLLSEQQPDVELQDSDILRSANAREAYEFFDSPENRIEDISPKQMIAALRVHALGMTREESVRRALDVNLRKWVAIANAVEFIEKDDRIQKITPYFEEVKDRGSETSMPERVYEGMRHLVLTLLDKSAGYTIGEISFIADGLWHKGYFVKNRRGGDTETERTIDDRDPRGKDAQFVSPAKHLMKRYKQYDAVLWNALETMLNRGDVGADAIPHDSYTDKSLGRLLYRCVPAHVRDSTFTNLITGEPLDYTKGDKGEVVKLGTQLDWVMQFYVGVNRERIKDKIEGHLRTRRS